MKKGALELQDWPQGVSMGIARNSQTWQRSFDKRQKLIDSLYAEITKNNAIKNKAKGSKGGMR